MISRDDLTLVLFECDLERIREAHCAGISNFLVDWESNSKKDRQKGYDMEINRQTRADLVAMAVISSITVWCRLNSFGPWTREEVESALDAGASVLLLPMIRSSWEVEKFLRYCNGRCRVGVLIETREACQDACNIAALPLDVVYIGLNDLMISLGTKSIFSALDSGVVDKLRPFFKVSLFGFGGVTVLDQGSPLPCRVFMQEMARLEMTMTFLRRSFKRDIVKRNVAFEVCAINAYWQELLRRTNGEIVRDYEGFLVQVKRIESNFSLVCE